MQNLSRYLMSKLQRTRLRGSDSGEIFRIALLLLLAPHSAALSATDNDDPSAAILQVVESFFSAMTARDVDTMRTLMTRDGIISGHRVDSGEAVLFTRSHIEYLTGLGAGEALLVERIWDPEITVRGPVAGAWTPYDFYIDGEFSHCGFNNFSFLKTADGWKIAGVAYSMKLTDCPESPLGPYTEPD